MPSFIIAVESSFNHFLRDSDGVYVLYSSGPSYNIFEIFENTID